MNLSAGVTWQQICTTETCGAVCISVLVVAITIAFLKFMMDRKYGEYPPATSYSFREFLDSFITGQVHRHHIKMCKESGPVYRIPIIGWNSLFIVHDPTVAKIIMEGDSKHGIPESEKSLRYKTLTKLTCGVQTMLTKRTNDENWQTSRKAVAPSFSMTNLYQVLPELSVKLNQFKDILDAHVLQGKQLIDLPEWMIRVTIDVLATSMFRTDYHTLKIHSLGRGIIDVDKSLGDSSKATPSETDGERFVRSVPIMSREYIMRGALQPFRKYKFWDKQIMKEIAEADEAALAVYHISKNVLQEYRQRHTKEELEGDKSILAHLIRSPYKSDSERIADVTTFMMAGHDTTAYQLSWIIIELSRNPKVVEKLRIELDAIFPSRDTAVIFTPQHLSQLSYLNLIIKEGMRLWPVTAVGTSRIAAANIPYGNKVIPKGSIVGIGFFAMFRSGISKPDEFIPERWYDTDVDATKLKEMCVPFSSGKRQCVGQNLALLELKLVLSTLFYSYDFELTSDITEMYYITLKPQNANFKISRRI